VSELLANSARKPNWSQFRGLRSSTNERWSVSTSHAMYS